MSAMTQVVNDNGTLRRRIGAIVSALTLVVALGGSMPPSACADERERREEWREHREREREWREREWREREWRERHEYHPYAYAPPAVVYTPPVQAPALNFVFPLNLR
jgi:hypothetical protein